MSSSDSEEEVTPKKHLLDENAELPALFWDAMPENPEEHPDFIAMQALAEESTPEERAENFKVLVQPLGPCTAAGHSGTCTLPLAATELR